MVNQNDVSSVESGWVKLCPFLEVTPAHPLSAHNDSESKSVIEIYEFCKGMNPNSPLSEFKKLFNRLPVIPKPGETRLTQTLKAIKLLKIAQDALDTHNNTKKALKHLGIK